MLLITSFVNLTSILSHCSSMVEHGDLSQTQVSSSAQTDHVMECVKAIADYRVIKSVSGELLHKSMQLSHLPLPARMRNSRRPLGEPILRCLMSMTGSLLVCMPVVDGELTDMIAMMVNPTKTLLDRIGVDNHYPTAHLHLPSNTKLMRHSTSGKSKNYSPLPLSHRILSAPTLWSRITPQTLNMPYGHSSPVVSSHLSQNRNGNMPLQGRQSILMSYSLDSSPPSPKTKPQPQLGTLISPSVEVSP